MKILFIYSDFQSSKASFSWRTDSTTSVKTIREHLSAFLGLQLSNFQLITKICGKKVLMTDSWPVSFFLEDNSKVKIKSVEHSNNLRAYSVSYSKVTKECYIFDYAIGLCKKDEVLELMQIFDFADACEESIIHQSNDNKWTLLHFACFYGSPKTVEYLISKKVNPNRVTIDEWLPIQLCIYFHHPSCLEAILHSKSIQINKKTKTRGTALHLACEQQNLSLVNFILSHNPDLSIEDHRSRLAIELVKSQDILELLAIYSGECQLKKYQNQPKPADFCSEVFMVNTFALHDRFIFLYLDTSNCTLNRYNKKSDFLDNQSPATSIRLTEILDIKIDLNKKGLHFFTVETEKNTFKYFTKFETVTVEWADRLFAAGEYALAHQSSVIVESVNERTMLSIEDESTFDSSHCLNTTDSEGVDFNSFSILNEIGKGSFGVVYKVIKNSSGEVFAMKSLKKSLLHEQKQLKYAISESKILRNLNHPFIVPLIYAFQNSKFIYLVLELCSNGDLLSMIEKKGKFEEPAAKFYLAEIVLALEYLHSVGIIYRDLKPGNILLDKEFHIRLTDFGLAKQENSLSKQIISFAGTPAYLPPEIINKKPSTTASDIYGLGPLLYEMLTGQTPYFNEDIHILLQNIKSSKLFIPSYLSKQAQDFIIQVMNKDPVKRPQLSQLKRHQFFRKIDWDALRNKKIKPPFKLIV